MSLMFSLVSDPVNEISSLYAMKSSFPIMSNIHNVVFLLSQNKMAAIEWYREPFVDIGSL